MDWSNIWAPPPPVKEEAGENIGWMDDFCFLFPLIFTLLLQFIQIKVQAWLLGKFCCSLWQQTCCCSLPTTSRALWCERMRSVGGGGGSALVSEAAVRGAAELRFQHGRGCGHRFLPQPGMVPARARPGLTSPPPPSSESMRP